MRFKSSDKKSILTAAFVCICAVGVLAGVASYGMGAWSKPEESVASDDGEIYEPPIAQEVLISRTPTTDFSTADKGNQTSVENESNEIESNESESNEAPKPNSNDINPSVSNAENAAANAPAESDAEKQPAPEAQPSKEDSPASSESEASGAVTEVEYEEAESAGIFDNEVMFTMPVSGEIVLDYSIANTIYDPTLDMYRTNNGISISASAGEDVAAAAQGTVKDVFNDTNSGRTVVISHKDGWETTYGQLSEDVAVAVGENVNAGQIIGSVSEPTKYGAALGSHLDFKVSRSGESIDPKLVTNK